MIVPRVCPECGYDLSGHNAAEVVTCPECGAAVLPGRPPPRPLGPLLRWACLPGSVALLLAVAMGILAPGGLSGGPLRSAAQLLAVAGCVAPVAIAVWAWLWREPRLPARRAAALLAAGCTISLVSTMGILLALLVLLAVILGSMGA